MNADLPRLISPATQPDTDPLETREWLDSLDTVLNNAGGERAQFLLQKLEERLRNSDGVALAQPYSAYRNTVALERQGAYPGDLAMEERLTAILRWNALAMVMRANQAYGDLGGHIASYASAAEIFEVGDSTISSTHATPDTAAISSTSSRTRHLASMHAHSWKDG